MGSLKWFVYKTDLGELFAVFLDESNVEAVNGSEGDYTPQSTVRYALPRNVKPRRAVYESLDGRIRREIVVLNPANFDDIPQNKKTITDQYREITLHLRSLKGERIRLPYASDTALNDGDDT